MIKPGAKVRIHRIGRKDAAYDTDLVQRFLNMTGTLDRIGRIHPGGYKGCDITWDQPINGMSGMTFFHVQLQEVK